MQISEILKYKSLQASVIGIFLLGGGIGWVIGHHGYEQALNYLKSIHSIRSQNPNYKFTRPLLASDSSENNFSFAEYSSLKEKITDLINQETNQGRTDHVSVYFRDLNNGQWLGINQNDNYYPASLLKVPLMIAYLKQAEQDSTLLDKKITFTAQMNTESIIPFETPTKLSVGSSYSVNQLIKAMIVDSDNGAKDVLLDTVDQNALSEIYTDLGIGNPDDTHSDYQISPKTYSLFFRVLYNATYLSPQMSEKALGLLAAADYSNGLTNQLPKDISVAHKFGEHVNTDNNNQATGYELHDCGIIYKPNNPYLLCVMTKGSDINKLQTTISDISKLVYDQKK